jgi:hypothetical protein
VPICQPVIDNVGRTVHYGTDQHYERDDCKQLLFEERIVGKHFRCTVSGFMD